MRFFKRYNSLATCTALAIAMIALVARTAGAQPALDPKVLHKMDDDINLAIDEKRCPGAVLWVEHGEDTYWKAFGHRVVKPEQEDMTKDTIFDLASLTKVVAG